MTCRLIAAACLVLAVASAPSAQTDEVHTFQVRDGAVYLNGRHLPGAVPDGLDLSGETTQPLEFSGPITPVLEIDGEAYVLEGERLVLLSESSRAGRGVYILSDADAEAVPEDHMEPIVEAAYMRDVASRNTGLYDRMQREHAMESEVSALTARFLETDAGAQRTRLRAQLRALISDLLALKHEIRAEEIMMAEQRIEDARRSLSYRQGHHDEIVDGRLRELIGEQ